MRIANYRLVVSRFGVHCHYVCYHIHDLRINMTKWAQVCKSKRKLINVTRYAAGLGNLL